MATKIIRKEITRISEVDFVDGTDIVGEALEYTAPCGCTVVYGVRYKGGLNEICCLVWPCLNHRGLREKLLECGKEDHPMYERKTEEAIAWAIENIQGV